MLVLYPIINQEAGGTVTQVMHSDFGQARLVSGRVPTVEERHKGLLRLGIRQHVRSIVPTGYLRQDHQRIVR